MNYTDIPGFFDYADLYQQRVKEAPEAGAVFVELGCWYGRSTVYLAQTIANSGKQIRFLAVDNFQGDYREMFYHYLDACGVRGAVQVVEGDSAVAAQDVADGSVDFVFIDADHSYEAVRRDIAAWRPKLKPGGIMAGHDRSRDGVHRAVVEAFGGYEPVGVLCWQVKM